jgi:hypothetical protein
MIRRRRASLCGFWFIAFSFLIGSLFPIGQLRCMAYQSVHRSTGNSLNSRASPAVRSPVSNSRTTAGTSRSARGANETYAVIEIGDDIQAVLKSEINSLKKHIDEEYKKEMKEYQVAKKGKDNHSANMSKPVKKVVKILKSSFKTKEEALKFVEGEKEKGRGKKTTSHNLHNY